MVTFRTKLVNDRLYKKNGEKVNIIATNANGINATVMFNDGTIADVYTSELIDEKEDENTNTE